MAADFSSMMPHTTTHTIENKCVQVCTSVYKCKHILSYFWVQHGETMHKCSKPCLDSRFHISWHKGRPSFQVVQYGAIYRSGSQSEPSGNTGPSAHNCPHLPRNVATKGQDELTHVLPSSANSDLDRMIQSLASSKIWGISNKLEQLVAVSVYLTFMYLSLQYFSNYIFSLHRHSQDYHPGWCPMSRYKYQVSCARPDVKKGLVHEAIQEASWHTERDDSTSLGHWWDRAWHDMTDISDVTELKMSQAYWKATSNWKAK